MTTSKSLEDRIQEAGSAVTLLRQGSGRADTGPLTGGEVSNWRDEQLAWRETVSLFDLSHHMTDLTVRGPDALRVVSDLGVNSVANFTVGRAKQFVAVNEDGHLVGDAIVDHIAEDEIRFQATPVVPNWVQFHLETGDYDVTWSRDEPTATNPLHHPELYRFQLQGPRSMDLLEKVTGGRVPDVKFFRAATMTIGGRRVRALGHGMARSQGMELTGPWAEAAQIRELLLEAGQEFGLAPAGSRAPTPAGIESGWFPAPLPAVYSGTSTKAYREWLRADSFEATGSIGGSSASADIRDYYLTPHDLNYSRLVAFDHDFVGRSALEKAVDTPQRRKVTLAWDTRDVLGVIASQFEKGTPGKFMEFPLATYSTWPYDTVLAAGRDVGFSSYVGYTYNERRMLSLAVVDEGVEIGSEVTVVWGEEDGGTHKPQVERHVQKEIRAVVARTPYSDVYNA